ncbi:nucleotidyl transferase AbiEii/AbiGii toxin family protein [Candidatus Desulforudis audaxviator]|nr:nucleotidyl transferase AbiEii/AbiGii toxin family protein [Candidatus Desulforudis audaxviator]
MFWDVLDRPRHVLLSRIVSNMPVPGSYLAGGTALALMFGHRKSVDFDWFSPEQFDPEQLYYRLSSLGRTRIAETRRGTFHGFVNDIRLTWLYYPNPLLEPLVAANDIPGFFLASLKDIAVMKWVAISSRGARKDFIDLYSICRSGYDLEELLSVLPLKYPGVDINSYHMVKSLSYFDDAEREVMPVMLKEISWRAVKEYFLAQQKRLLNRVKT